MHSNTMASRAVWALLPIVGTVVAQAPASYNTSCSADAIPKPVVFGANITSVVAQLLTNYGATGLNACSVNVTLTHPGTGDEVHNQILLPLNWNGIHQGVGGGGFAAGAFSSLVPIAAQGYACATTDTGHTPSALYTEDASPWALVSEGNVNQYLLRDFAYQSYHDNNLLAKQVIESFYGKPAQYSYWNGCSTGGRQGMVSAQRYPTDYDGILADAPAIQWNDFTPAQQWPFTVMNNDGYAPLQCEFSAINAATIKACDGLDGVQDGIISAPAICNFSAQSLVGQQYVCSTDGQTRTYQQKTADIVAKLWAGPRTTDGDFLWYGLTKGTNFSTLANTTVAANGSSIAVAFGISDSWYRYFLAKNPDFDTANITYADFDELFLQGHLEYDSTMGTYSPDLAEFKNAGGKMITWQGLQDQIIMPQGNMLYYEKVLALDPTAHDFYRQFYSPGVGHCGGGTGVIPIDPIGTLRAWVENGTAPDALSAASEYPVNASSAYVTNGMNVRFQVVSPLILMLSSSSADAVAESLSIPPSCQVRW